MPFEAQRSRQLAVPVPMVAVAGFVSAGWATSARSRSSQTSRMTDPSAGAAANLAIAASASATSPSAPRSSSISTRNPVAGNAPRDLPSGEHLIDRLPYHPDGTSAVAVSGALTPRVHFDSGEFQGSRCACTSRRTRPAFAPALTVFSGVPKQEHATQYELDHANGVVVARCLGGLQRLLDLFYRGVVNREHSIYRPDTVVP